jgi:hypothetical protein
MTMKNDKVCFVVEGAADENFIRQLVREWFGIELLTPHNFILIRSNNAAELEKFRVDIERRKFEGYNVILVFDEDESEAETRQRLTAHPVFANLDELYLWPGFSRTTDDARSRNLETLLSKLIVDEHRGLFECYSSYSNCINVANGLYVTPDSKTQLYVYTRTLLLSYHKKYYKEGLNKQPAEDLAHEKNRDYTNTKIWNLNVSELLYFKKFLEPYFNQ